MATERFRLPELNAGQTNRTILSADTQSRRLLIALAILLVVLAAVVEKNSDFWFGPGPVADAESATPDITSNPAPTVSTHTQAVATESPVVKVRRAAKASAASAQPVPAAAQQNAADTAAPVVASHRVALPPLEAEVVAGDKHSTVHPGSNAMVAEIPSDPNRPVVTSASEYEHLAAAASPELRQTIEAPYPMLSQHSRVQGSVVLEAVIGADGVIEGLRLVSGPAILNNAAQQAVRQWRFKPYLLNGRAVETKCMVTVNFSIRVSDASSTIS